ncbi:T9SS type A sorting domain-containing protein [Adhaeribacter soli]|uniref:T9SS type A sorting domain-containing protein n=1 Tax=Adhaeribacter soli TaxID=2607655 RepID=A0A5N1IZT5_9BACT|nr:T9SS type A sorting domain-containing protein [Adhaeribacter soli]KAA9338976.1 T9SS type A sorting domain-containing protein [Adhaeribacter soli]
MKNYLLSLLFFTIVLPAFSQFVHQSTLLGTSFTNTAAQGMACAISADGNVAVVGGETDSLGRGAAWVYTRNGNQWTQMGKKLVPNDAVSTSAKPLYFGCATAISADGNTIAIGGYYENNRRGATWIFVRNGNRWEQQGPKLVGTQGFGDSFQGSAIALSADGNTLLIGGNEDNGNRGAVWFFQRTGTTWSPQSGKIIVTPNNGWSFGYSVALSADGNTALIGALYEGTPTNKQGYGYFYKRTGSTWNFLQKVTDLTVTNSRLGEGVALSGNGQVAIIGGGEGNQTHGIVCVFRFDQSTQLWVKDQILTSTGTSPGSRLGRKISISKGGDTLAVSGYLDQVFTGAVWTFVNKNGTWSQLGNKITSPISGGVEPEFGRSLSLSADGKILLIGRPNGSAQGAAFIYSDSSFVMSTTKELQPELSPYPNPVKDFLHLPLGTAFSQLTLSDLSGKVLLRQTSPTQRLDLSTFSAGIYIVSLQQKDKVLHVRIVKE